MLSRERITSLTAVDFVFLAMDWLGAFFSLMALVAQQTFDVLGGVLYICCIMLEAGIFLSHFIWLLRTRKLRKRAKDSGIDFDDLPEARKYQVIDPELGSPVEESAKTLNTEERKFWRRSRKTEIESPRLMPEDPVNQGPVVKDVMHGIHINEGVEQDRMAR